MVRTGGIDHGTAATTRELAAVLEARGVPHTVLSASEAADRRPQFGFESEALFQPGAGVLDAESTVTGMLDLARRQGADVRIGWTVTAVEPDAGGYVLRSAEGDELRAEQVIVAAGGWLPQLLPVLPLSQAFRSALPPFEVTQEQAFHFPYAEGFPSGDLAHRDPQDDRLTVLRVARRSGRGVPGSEDRRVPGREATAPAADQTRSSPTRVGP